MVSFLRLASVKNYATTSNPTWDQWSIVWWSTIELEVGFICTCLPTLRLILVRMAPRAFGSQDTALSYVTTAEPFNLRGEGELTRRRVYRANMNRLESNSTMHIQLEADDDETLDGAQPKRSSAPTSSSIEMVPQIARKEAVNADIKTPR